MIEKMLKLAQTAMHKAYSPYSNFKVGCCIRTTDNEFYTGCNIENASYSLTICAEGSAIGSMIPDKGKQQIAEVVIIGTSDQPCSPCGACRQLLSEFSSPDTLLHLYSENGKTSTTKSMAELLPLSFNEKFFVHQ